MAKHDDNTAPAREALAAWDKLFNERETLNQILDCSNDAAYHQPEGKVPAETVRELATAAIFLEQTNALIDRANERQARRPADEAQEMREEIADTILTRARRHGFTVQHSEGEFPYQLVGPKVTVEGLAKQVAELDGARQQAGDLRSRLADAINRVVVMSEFETDEMVDSIINTMGSAGDGKDALNEASNGADFAIPELLSERHADRDRRVHDILMAANDHAKHLRKAESRLAQAKGVAETLRCALRSDDYDPEPFADEIAAQIVDLLDKAQSQVDRHSNLFLAYFDRRANPDVEDALSRLRAWETKCEAMPIGECADRLRMFLWDANEIMTAEFEEDGYSVVKTYTRKGLRHHLAQLEFLQEITEPDDTEGDES